jgi:hypothetical protein
MGFKSLPQFGKEETDKQEAQSPIPQDEYGDLHHHKSNVVGQDVEGMKNSFP